MVKNNQKKNFFASTRQLNHIYKLLASASKINLEKRLGKKIFVANENYAKGILEGLKQHKFIS